MIIYMGSVMSILYYYGITQICASKMAWLMQKTMGTTAIETLGVSANIFLNGVRNKLLPYLNTRKCFNVIFNLLFYLSVNLYDQASYSLIFLLPPPKRYYFLSVVTRITQILLV